MFSSPRPPPVFDNRIPASGAIAPPHRAHPVHAMHRIPDAPAPHSTHAMHTIFSKGGAPQISPAIGELALAYIRRGIRPAR